MEIDSRLLHTQMDGSLSTDSIFFMTPFIAILVFSIVLGLTIQQSLASTLIKFQAATPYLTMNTATFCPGCGCRKTGT